jgi:hypothetical protein
VLELDIVGARLLLMCQLVSLHEDALRKLLPQLLLTRPVRLRRPIVQTRRELMAGPLPECLAMTRVLGQPHTDMFTEQLHVHSDREGRHDQRKREEDGEGD